MSTIKLEPNPLSLIERGLGLIERRRGKALADALNDTAKDVRKRFVTTLPNYFTLRTRWVQKGFRIKWATPKTLTAEIGHLDAYMALQESGGRKVGRGGKSVAVPWKGARPTLAAKTPPGKWPNKILKRRNAFVADGGNVGVAKRRKRRRGEEGPTLENGDFVSNTVWFWGLRSFVTVPKNWEMTKEATTAAASFVQHMGKRIGGLTK